MKFEHIIKSADWKTEKHSPVIEAPETVKAGEKFVVDLSVGKEIPHPNTTEHHIRWIKLYFMPEGGKFPFEVANVEFTVHGESVEGPNKGPVYTEPHAKVAMKVTAPGMLIAASYCNIHGLWENAQEIKVEA